MTDDQERCCLNLTLDSGRYNSVWEARICGPWYDDSAPEGFASTKAEAEKTALQKLRQWHQMIENFLKDHQ